MNNVINPADLLTSLLTGEQVDLDYAQCVALEAHLEPALKAVKELRSKLDEQKRAHAIGEKFRFRGQRFVVLKHGSTTPWKIAYDIAVGELSATKRRVVETAVADLKTDTKKVREIN